MYNLKFEKQAVKDIEKIKRSNLKNKAKILIEIIKNNPFQTPPPYKKLTGDLSRLYSRRINIQHRIVYEVFEELKIVKIIRMWTHYDD